MISHNIYSHIALDIGSSSIKAGLLDIAASEIVRTVSLPFPAPRSGLREGHVEVDPRAIVETTQQLLRELLPRASTTCHVWVSGQMGGTILVDELGQPKSNYLSWRDQRATSKASGTKNFVTRIRSAWNEAMFASLGRELQAGSTTTLLYWLNEHRQLSDGVLPLSVADFVISHLTRQPGRMHATHAIGLLDLRSLDWHYSALERIGMGDLWLPELSHDLNEVGRWTMDQHTLIAHGAYGDQQCALYGAELATNELSINVSTGSQVSMRTAQFESGDYQTRAYFDHSWLNTITHLPAGRSLNVLVDLLTELARSEGITLQQPWTTIAQSMQQAEATQLAAQLSFFAGPMGDSGSLSNITTDNLNVGQLFLAAGQNMADNYAAAAQRLSPAAQWQTLVLSGSLPQTLPRLVSLIVQQLQRLRSDQAPIPVRQFSGEETLIGLMKLARSV